MRNRTILTLTAILPLLGAVSASAAESLAFLRKAMEGDNSEIMLGKLVQEKGTRQEVKDLGRMLEQDHTQAREQILALAKKMNVQPSDKITPEARAEARKLNRLSGDKFDLEFISYAVKDHKKDISEYNAEAKKKVDSAQLAQQTLPILQKHLDMAQSLAK